MIIADIGAGTGILTKHFVKLVQKNYAIEPNAELRYFLKKALGDFPGVSIMDGSAEETGLPDNSVDLITVAQAIHWFEPRPAKEEILRILKEDGWLALLRNYGTDNEQNMAIGTLMTEEYGANFSVVHERSLETPVNFYFGHGNFQRRIFSFKFKQSRDEFIGALTTASYMPDEDHPLFYRLEEEAKRIFTQHSNDGYLTVKGETELLIGQPQK